MRVRPHGNPEMWISWPPFGLSTPPKESEKRRAKKERMEMLFQGCLGSDRRRDDPDLEWSFCTGGLLGGERLHGGAD